MVLILPGSSATNILHTLSPRLSCQAIVTQLDGEAYLIVLRLKTNLDEEPLWTRSDHSFPMKDEVRKLKANSHDCLVSDNRLGPARYPLMSEKPFIAMSVRLPILWTLTV